MIEHIDWITLNSLIAVIASMAALILAWRKAPHETRVLDADAEAKISDAAIKLLEPLQKRIEELEASKERQRASITELERRISELECELRDERNQKADIIVGAEKLAHQVESLGAQPVYRPPRRGGTGELKSK